MVYIRKNVYFFILSNIYFVHKIYIDPEDGIWETWYYTAQQPVPQQQSDLYNCEIHERDGLRYSYCRRPYDTGDTNNDDDDFYEFVQGANSMIWGFGPIDKNGNILKHGTNSYGEAHDDIIYLNGDAQCGYAQSQISKESGMTKEEETWMIIAIVFIVCFAIVLGILLFLLYKIKQDPEQRNKFSKVSDADEQEPINTQ